jgi:hypothetical protein
MKGRNLQAIEIVLEGKEGGNRMDVLAIAVIVLGLVIARIILERARERSNDQDVMLMRLIYYGNRHDRF